MIKIILGVIFYTIITITVIRFFAVATYKTPEEQEQDDKKQMEYLNKYECKKGFYKEER